MQFTYIFALFFALVVAVFAILNAQPVTIDYVFGEFQISLAVVILASAFAGAIILGFLGIFRKVKEGLKAREMNSKIRKLEEQLKETEGKLGGAEAKVEELEGSLLDKESRINELQNKLTEWEDKEKAEEKADEKAEETVRE